MRSLRLFVRALTLALVLAFPLLCDAHAQDSTATMEARVRELLAPVTAASHARDSVSALADKARGDTSIVFEEQVWQYQLQFQTQLLKAAQELEDLKKEGADLSAAKTLLDQAVRNGWPRYLRQLDRRDAVMAALIDKRNSADASGRLAVENEISEYSDRTAKMYQDLVEALLVVEDLGVDVKRQRTLMANKLRVIADQTSARLGVLQRAHSLATARIQRSPDDNAARTELDATNESLDRAVRNLQAEIGLLEKLGTDASALEVSLIVNTGTLNASIFKPRVIAGLFDHWRQRLMDTIATRAGPWLFQVFMIALILVGFWLLGRLVRRLVRHAVGGAPFSQLLKDTVTSWSARLVVAVGIVVVLRQLGVQLGPLLAGFGIAGVVLGFALQDTLANFAAGGMILAYRPFDVGDTIQAGGAEGTVQKMSLVSTTVITYDNQKLIVPNRKVWSDVIRNITAHSQRRMDLTFVLGADGEPEKVERLLKEIVDADKRVLRGPAPDIHLDKITDATINYVVRVWTLQADYQNVYWDLTRAVKLRLDAEGIKLPPSRELIVVTHPGRVEEPR
jgi:small conductance mechanosensitive channel